MLNLSLDHIEVPKGYKERLDEQGCKYYVNLDTGAESWRHPGKYHALQELGIVDCPGKTRTVPAVLEALNDWSVEVPAPWIRVQCEGMIGYTNADDGATQFEHPYANPGNVFPPWVPLKDPDGRVYYWNEDEQRAQTENPYAKIRNDALQAALAREAGYWARKGHPPPWVIEEKAVPQGRRLWEWERYLVDYRTDSIVGIIAARKPQREEARRRQREKDDSR
ncbi:hypothetical protein MAPG_01886 [Magnaporthiopsis poae ATCC 64411]|uniref:WW domain-containing protein n=1 Tax=Magnaporthiopsis poae (strain ATCC 64411 / 73-15) TaxID=644358 RepID=A0A0C4DPV7_MAGP6|nr:hypothetical protein MAPG_01886 [Magnaporthiopsis poae ATCC 64411]